MMDRSFFSPAFRVMAVLSVAWLLAGSAGRVTATTPSPAAALKLEPVQKSDVDYEQVPESRVQECSVANIKREGWAGWEVIASDGTLLRRFADTNDDGRIDLWCYFRYGIEVYRDIDTEYDGKADQYRWLGTGGTRWAIDEDEDGQIDSWRQISAEEVSAELVAALRDSDSRRFANLLIKDSEIKSLGLSAAKAGRIGAKARNAARDFESLAKRQNSVSRSARWVQFAAPAPGVVPSGTDGSTRDIVVYENAVAMFQEGERTGQFVVGTLVRVGDSWRLVDLPSLETDGEAVAQTPGNFFTPESARPGRASLGGDESLGEETQQLIAALEKIDTRIASVRQQTESETERAQAVAALEARRADVIEQLIAQSPNPGEHETWVRQLVDTLSIAIQSGDYPDGLERLQAIASTHGKDNQSIQAYADFEAVNTEYVVRQTPDADFTKVQQWYLTKLDDFIERYPQAPETARAWFQKALSKELEGKNRDAIGYYSRLAKNFRGTSAAQKAEGAVRRLDSIGNRLDLSGKTVDGKTFRLGSLRGKPVVIHYWATWCEPCKQDMKLLRRLQANYKRDGLQIVGVNVDGTADLVENFLRQSPVPWTQIHEPGGLENSPPAVYLGVQTLPTTLLIDPSGKVVRHNIRVDELDQELDQMLRRKER